MLRFDIDPDVLHARLPPPEIYTDAAHYQRILHASFGKGWQFLAHQTEITEPVTPFLMIPNTPTVLTEADDQLRLLSNVCTHRARLVATAPCRTLRCGYHGRTFGPEGRVRAAPGFDMNELDESDDLPPLAVETWNGLVFGSIGPLYAVRETLAAVDVSGLPWKRLDAAGGKDYTVRANWMSYVENYLEGFHIPYVHRGLAARLDLARYETRLLPWGTLQVGWAEPGELTLPNSEVAAWYIWIFPGTMINIYPWGVSMNIVEPLAVDHTRVRFRRYEWEPGLRDDNAGSDLDQVEMEDEAVVESVAQGLRSPLAGRGRYAPVQERGVHHFHRLIALALGEG